MFESTDRMTIYFAFEFASVLGIACGLLLFFTDSHLKEIKIKIFGSKVVFKERILAILDSVKILTVWTAISFVMWFGIGIGYLLLEAFIYWIV